MSACRHCVGPRRFRGLAVGTDPGQQKRIERDVIELAEFALEHFAVRAVGIAEHGQYARAVAVHGFDRVRQGKGRKTYFRQCFGRVGRGLLGRFLYALPASMLGRRDINPPAVPEAVYYTYCQSVRALLNTPFANDETGEPCPHRLTFDTAGRERLQRFEAWVEPQLSEFGELGGMTDWGGKLVGVVVRIAGLLHMADLVGTDNPWKVPIPAATVERAIAVAMYLIPHAKAAFAEMGADEVVDKAKAILRWIQHNKLDSFTRREAHQGMRGTFKRVIEADSPLAVLVDRGFVRERQETLMGGPGRPSSPTYDVNPRWACQNKQNFGRYGNSEYCEDSETASSKSQDK